MNLADTGSKPLLMGVLNVTPDSFSDGGLHQDFTSALSRVHEMVQQGADIIDIGGESTRPGADRVSVEQQLGRVIPIIKQLQQELPADIPVSIDTTSTIVAGAGLEQGAAIINDISAGQDDPGMFRLVAEAGVPYIIMHMQGTPAPCRSIRTMPTSWLKSDLFCWSAPRLPGMQASSRRTW